MPRSIVPVTAFAAGEIAELLGGRVDVNFYHIAARVMLNMRPLPHGPAQRRGGSQFIAYLNDESAEARLLPFVFAASQDQAYQVEHGPGACRFIIDQGDGPGVIAAADTDAAITNGDFPSGITGWTDASTGTATLSHDATNGRMNLNGASASIAIARQAVTTTATDVEHVVTFRVFGSRYDQFECRVGTSAGGTQLLQLDDLKPGWHAVQFTPTASPFYFEIRHSLAKTLQLDDVAVVDAAPVVIGSPITADLDRIKITQSNDLLWLCHPAHWPRVLERRGHATWSNIEYAATDGPYLAENAEAGQTLQPGATSGYGVTVTAAGHSPFKSSDVGRLLTIKHSTTWGWGVIVGYTSATVVTVDVQKAFAATTAEVAWKLGAWREAVGGNGGYPPAVRFSAEERLFFLGEPGRVDSSKTGDFDNYEPGTDDDSPVSISIADNRTNRGIWLASASDMLVGTTGSEFRITPQSGSGLLTPGTTAARFQSARGSADIQALEIASAVIFVQRHGAELIESRFSLELEAFDTIDLTRRAQHLTRAAGGMRALAYQQQPYGMIWIPRRDGLLLSLTYLREEQVIAWARHELGRTAADLANVEEVSVIPGDGHDVLYLIVKRTIDGQVRRMIEVMREPLADDRPVEEGFYVDCGLTLDNTISATLTPAAGAVTAGATGVVFTAGSGVFVSGDVGRFIRYRYQVPVTFDATENAGRRGVRHTWATAVARITAYTSATEVETTILLAFPSDAVSPASIAAGGWRMTVTTVTGLDHLEGETLAINGDGATQPSQVVASGAVSLDVPAATIHAGLAFRSLLIPVRYEAATPDGTSQGRRQKVSRLVARLHRSGEGFQFGDGANWVTPPIREVADPMDAPAGLVSGDVFALFPGSLGRNPIVALRQDLPMPLMVTMLMPQAEVDE